MTEQQREPGGKGARASRPAAAVLALAILAGLGWLGLDRLDPGGAPRAAPAMPPAAVTVSPPLARDIAARLRFLGQFSAVDRVELRAQVGGILTAIGFADGQIVHQGDLLFEIDPRPYRIRLEAAQAQFSTAQARLALADSQLWRAQQLARTHFGTEQDVDQRTAEQSEARAAVDAAAAAMRDAELDLGYCRVTAPFTGRIGAHLVSVGALVSGSRAGTGPTTLLATLDSLDPIHLDFDMSETDFLEFQRLGGTDANGLASGATVALRLADETGYTRTGRLDFIDNAIDRSSGTIHARATVPNPDFALVPGEFARVRLTLARAEPALLVPAAAIVPDQSQSLVMTVSPAGVVVPKPVRTGGLRGGLRVIEGGLAPTDRVIIDGLARAMPGATVAPEPGRIRFDAAADGQD